jgi:hypothetical protein
MNRNTFIRTITDLGLNWSAALRKKLQAVRRSTRSAG